MIHVNRPTVLRWLQVGRKEGATHMLLVEDVMANDNVPVYVSPKEKLGYKVSRFDAAHKMRLIAIFDLLSDFEEQLNSVYKRPPSYPE